MATPPPPGDVGEDMEEAFALYRRAMKLVDMGNAFLEWVQLAYSDCEPVLTAVNPCSRTLRLALKGPSRYGWTKRH